MHRKLAFLLFLLVPFSASAQAPKREVNVWVARDVAPGHKIQINLNTRNIRAVTVSAFPVDAVAWLSRPDREDVRPNPGGPPVSTWRTSMEDPRQRPSPAQTDRYYSRQVNLPTQLKPGVYLLQVAAAEPGVSQPSDWGVVNVTHLAVVSKRSPKRTLTWVTDALNGKVVPNATVTLFNQGGRQVSTAQTNADGVAQMATPFGAGTLVIRRGTDYAGVSAAAENPDGRLTAHFQTDRPIYRPGQTVMFKSILRRTLGRTYSVVADAPVVVEVRDPKDIVLERLSLKSNAMGSVAGEFSLPSEGATGAYTLRLAQGQDSAYQSFTVAEYRKPEFKVEVKPGATRYLAGDKIAFQVQADTYFGSPVAQAQVAYSVRRASMPYWQATARDDWFASNDGNLYSRDTYGQDEYVADDSVFTDAEGRATIIVPTRSDAGDSNYIVAVTVTDGSRRQVSGNASVRVYAANVRLGLRVLASYVPVGRLIPLELRASDLDGRPVGATAKVTLWTEVWDKKKEQWVDQLLETTQVRVPPAGTAKFELPAKGRGGTVTIRVEAPDGTGRVARTSADAYLASPFAAPEEGRPEEPELDIRPTKSSYKAGETIRAFVATNKPKTPVLVVLEGADIWGYTLIPAGTRGREWSFSAGVALSPNAHLSASQWVQGQMVSTQEVVPVPDSSRQMRVEITPDKTEYRPGDTATYRVRTLDESGRGVPAEVALSVVDEAIYALRPDTTPDLYRFYWGLRPNRVNTHYSAPEEMSGGAYQRVSSVAPLRQRFEDTAYWSAFVQTDAAGNGVVSFEMPGNLTTWRATGRAVTADTRVGTSVSAVKATRSVTLRLAMPRQMVQGDQLTLIGTVNNRTDQEREFEVSLEHQGHLEDERGGTRRIRIPAQSEGRVDWKIQAFWLNRQGPSSFTGRVRDVADPTAEGADALRVSLNMLPNGIVDRQLASGAVGPESQGQVAAPEGWINGAGDMRIRVWAGVTPVLEDYANRVLDSHRYSVPVVAAQLEVAAARGLDDRSREVREAIAYLSKTQSGTGWGWWENTPADPVITAAVLRALVFAENAPKINVPDQMISAAVYAARALHNNTNLFEHRALLASAIAGANKELGAPLVADVARRGTNLSPYARMILAESLRYHVGDRESADHQLRLALEGLSAGPGGSTIPVGFGIGWSASQTATTALALQTDPRSRHADRLALWLTGASSERWISLEDQAAVAVALAAYLREHPESPSLGAVTAVVNGTSVEATPERVGGAVRMIIPSNLLRKTNDITIQRVGGGEAFFSVEARFYRRVEGENERGIRVIRRFEVLNSAGVWVELDRPVRPNEPVRCTTIAWGDSTPDAMRVVQPIPAGFEFVDSDHLTNGRQEVRDGAVVHYVLNSGTPVTFRYYLRAESEGTLVALPATAELLRRPSERGNSAPQNIKVIAP